MSVNKELLKLITEFFGKNENEITESSSKDTVEEWDSLEHLKLILALESKYAVRFPLEVIPLITSVKAIQEELDKIKNG